MELERTTRLCQGDDDAAQRALRAVLGAQHYLLAGFLDAGGELAAALEVGERNHPTGPDCGMKKKFFLLQRPALLEFIENEGQVALGYVQPVPYVAIASNEHGMLAALRRKRGESLISQLNRLDMAVALSEEYGSCIDEINGLPSARR